MTHESDPTRRIVDFDTFALWYIGHRAKVLANPARISEMDVRLAELGFDEDDAPEAKDPTSFPHLDGVPWKDIPDPVQEVLIQQYESAKHEPNNTVDILLDNETIEFEVKSPAIVSRVDTYGEYGTFPAKLRMSDRFGGRGLWVLSRNSMRKLAELEKLPSEEDSPGVTDHVMDLGRAARTNEPSTFIRATLPQLHSVARLLDYYQDKVVVRRVT